MLNYLYKYRNGLLGTIALILTLGFAYYDEYKNKINISFQLLSQSSVLDVHENIGKLDIIFDGTSIKETGERLSIYIIRLINDGQVVIRNNDYDIQSPLGLVIENGKVVESPTLLHGSNAYIQEQLKLTESQNIKTGKFSVAFSPLIMEPREYFDIKLLLLHPANSVPIITPIGKIAGIAESFQLKNMKAETSPSFYYKVFSGDVLVQLVRLISYFMGMIFAVLMVAALLDIVRNTIETRQNKRLLNQFYETLSSSITKEDKEFYYEFIALDPLLQTEIIGLILDSEKCQSALIECPRLKVKSDFKFHIKDGVYLKESMDEEHWTYFSPISIMAGLKLAIKDTDDTWKLNEDRVNKAVTLYNFAHPSPKRSG